MKSDSTESDSVTPRKVKRGLSEVTPHTPPPLIGGVLGWSLSPGGDIFAGVTTGGRADGHPN
jgi:hypothetical protein